MQLQSSDPGRSFELMEETDDIVKSPLDDRDYRFVNIINAAL